MRYLRTNTAVNVTIGPILDDSDGLTPLDAATVTGITGVLAYDDDDGSVGGHADFTCSASAGDNDLVAVGHNGLWTLELTAAQTNHLGRAILSLTDPDQICPVFHEFQILAANVYDSLFAGAGPTADKLDVNTAEVTAGAINNAAFAADVGSTAYATNIIALAADKALVQQNLDHLLAVACAGNVITGAVVNYSALALILAKADGDISDYSPTTDSLEALADGVAAIGIVGTQVAYSATTVVRTVGDNDGGAEGDTAAHDDVSMDTGENATTGLSVLATVATSTVTQIPAMLHVTGFYNGGVGHQINVQLYNWVTNAFETVGVMLSRTTAFDYTFPMTADHQETTANGGTDTGQMQVRFLHNVTTYNASHVLELDYINIDKQVTDSETASAIAAIKAQTDQMQFTLGNVHADVKDMADDVITASVFDESTAFPLKAADSGATAVARPRDVFGRPTWYVSAEVGNDSNDGMSWATAEATVNAALGDGGAGDLFLIGPGTYTTAVAGAVNVPIGSVVRGAGIDATILAPTTGVAMMSQGGTIENLTITDTDGLYGIFGVATSGYDLTVRNVTINTTANDAYGIHSSFDQSVTKFDNVRIECAGSTTYGWWAEDATLAFLDHCYIMADKCIGGGPQGPWFISNTILRAGWTVASPHVAKTGSTFTGLSIAGTAALPIVLRDVIINVGGNAAGNCGIKTETGANCILLIGGASEITTTVAADYAIDLNNGGTAYIARSVRVNPAKCRGNIYWVDNLDNILSTLANGDQSAIQAKLDGLVTGTTVLHADSLAEAFKVDMADVEDTAPQDSLCALVLGGLHWSLSGTTLTIKKTDATTFDTITVSTDTDADRIVGAG